MASELNQLIQDIGRAVKEIDNRRPQAANARTGASYQPGIGPHPETQAVSLILAELTKVVPERYQGLRPACWPTGSVAGR